MMQMQLFNKYYLNYLNFFVALNRVDVSSLICEESILREILSERVKSLFTLSGITEVNKDSRAEMLRRGGRCCTFHNKFQTLGRFIQEICLPLNKNIADKTKLLILQ